MRAALTRLHRYAGLALAGYLFVAGLTGSVIAFRPELDRWLNPDLLTVEPSAKAKPIEEQIAAVEAFDPRAAVLMIVLGAATDESTAFYMQPRPDPATGRPYALGYASIHVDPGNARILGTRDTDGPCCDRRTFVRFLYVLHYSLHGGPTFRLILGYVALVWLVDCFVGLALTFPRGRPFWRKWSTSWLLKRDAGPVRRNLDLHRAGGLWIWIVLAVTAFTGAYLNLRVPVFIPAIQSVTTVTPSIFTLRKASPTPIAPVLTYGDAQAIALAEAARSGWEGRLTYLWYGDRHGLYQVAFEDERHLMTEIYIDAVTGEILQRRPFGEGTPGDTFMSLQLPLHSGYILGLPGRILISLSGLVTAMLSVTGVIVWLVKRRARAASPSSVASPPTAPR